MFTQTLSTHLAGLRLVSPLPDRDAPLAVEWLADPHGRHTLKMMGVSDRENQSTTYDEEHARINEFLVLENQYNWMIELNGKIVGTIWVVLEEENNTRPPSIDIMIGDQSARGKGVGRACMKSVLAFLKENGEHIVYARHLTINNASKAMLDKLGFAYDDTEYTDKDNLTWQNRSLTI